MVSLDRLLVLLKLKTRDAVSKLGPLTEVSGGLIHDGALLFASAARTLARAAAAVAYGPNSTPNSSPSSEISRMGKPPIVTNLHTPDPSNPIPASRTGVPPARLPKLGEIATPSASMRTRGTSSPG